MAFNAEIITETITVVATAALVAGDPVTAAGAKASSAINFLGVTMTDAEIGDAMPVITEGVVAVDVDSSSTGVAAGDRITYATDGYDEAAAANGFGYSLDAASASGQIRMKIKHATAA